MKYYLLYPLVSGMIETLELYSIEKQDKFGVILQIFPIFTS